MPGRKSIATVEVSLMPLAEVAPIQYLSLSLFQIPVFQMTSLVAQTVKRLSTMWETWVQSLGRKIPLRRKWQPTPVLLPGKSHGWKSLVGYSPWGPKESDMTEQLHLINLPIPN